MAKNFKLLMPSFRWKMETHDRVKRWIKEARFPDGTVKNKSQTTSRLVLQQCAVFRNLRALWLKGDKLSSGLVWHSIQQNCGEANSLNPKPSDERQISLFQKNLNLVLATILSRSLLDRPCFICTILPLMLTWSFHFLPPLPQFLKCLTSTKYNPVLTLFVDTR